MYRRAVNYFGKSCTLGAGTFPAMPERHDRLRQARIAAGFERANDAAERFHWNVNTYKSNENGAAPFSFRKAKEYAQAFGVRAEWLYDAAGRMKPDAEPLVAVIGYVGADTEGSIIFSTGQESGDLVPVPPGGGETSRALVVRGHSGGEWAPDGSIIYFDDQRHPPTPDMIGYPCVVETEDGRVLLKRLLKGSSPGMYDLESRIGPTLSDVRLRWAAEVTFVAQPKQARRILRRAGEIQAA
jgi:hypothetical protein